jgi:adenylate cyclase
MTPCASASLAAWISRAGLAVADETNFLGEFCARASEAGLPLSNAIVFVDTLHPIYEGRVLRWDAQAGAAMALDYEPTEGERLEQWRRSPFYRLLETGETVLRLPIRAGLVHPFRLPSDLLGSDATEYLACVTRFAPEGVIGGLDCVYSGWVTRIASGFTDEQVAAIEELLPPLAIVLKSCALTRIAQTLVETYLGRDAGRRVLGGRISRGAVERISTALWFSDLRDFTRIAEAAAPDQLIPFLGEHAETVIDAIHAAGGDVLKLIGDGTLAIFSASDPAEACRAALAAAERAIASIAALGERRASSGLAATKLYLGLHFGDVFFGNIGSRERLDFTVVGPAVNEVSRIASMCRSLDQLVLISSRFASALGNDAERLVSVGRYALRGVGGAQHLFTFEAGTLFTGRHNP